MREIAIGTSCQVSAKVEEAMLARTLGSGNVDVLATPVMLALMEQAAVQCLEQYMGDGEATVSAQLEVAHISPAPVGEEITATAEVIKVEGKKIVFKVFCEDRSGLLGRGTHLRLLVNREKFEQRARKKL